MKNSEGGAVDWNLNEGCTTAAVIGCQPEATFEGGKWGDRPRPRASGLRASF